MAFLAPLSLIALLPWAAAAVWLLWGRHRQSPVPFLALWRGPVRAKPQRRTWRLPPIAVAALLAGALLAILATAGPVLLAGGEGYAGRAIPLIVDRGLTMSGADPSAPLFRALVGELAEAAETHGVGRFSLRLVPELDEAIVAADDLAGAVAEVPPTALDTSEALVGAVRGALADQDGPVVVVTDRVIGIDDGRIIQVTPARSRGNVAIAALAARAISGTPQVMVRLIGDAPDGPVALRVSSDGEVVERMMEWARDVSERTVFVDLSRLGDVVEARIDVADDVAADDAAWLVPVSDWPAVEPRAALSAEVMRVIDAYARARPASARPPIVAVTRTDGTTTPSEPSVILPTAASERADAAGDLAVAGHPVAWHVEWSRVLRDFETFAAAPAGWEPVVSVDGRAAVAVRDGPVRAAWVGLDVDGAAWARSPEFVIFWTNLFNWVASADDELGAMPVGPLDGDWLRTTGNGSPAGVPAGLWPGVYGRSRDGALRAVNVVYDAGTLPGRVNGTAWRAELSALAARDLGGGRPLSAGLLIGALACGVIAASAWPART